MIKFLRFSFFIIVPFAELYLPAYLLIFQNSKPSQFLSDTARNKKFIEIKERRLDDAKRIN
jgi:LETM1 and EF-hand domain-containing protein 1